MSQIGYKRALAFIVGAMLLVIFAAGCNPMGAKQGAKSGTQATASAGGSADSEAPPPEDQEISVNLLFRGADNTENGKPSGNLNFDFVALWGEYKRIDKSLAMPPSSSQNVALDLAGAKLYVKPRVNKAPYGMYDVQMLDGSGKVAGKWSITESGKQVATSGSAQGYDCNLFLFEPEKRITAYLISKPRPGYAKGEPKWGVVFVGKGWSWVENATPPDLSKGYLFPEVDLIVLPAAYLLMAEREPKRLQAERGGA